LPAEALAKAGFQSFKVSGFASRSFSEGWVSKFQGFKVSKFQALPAEALAKAGFQSFKVSGFASRKPVAASR